MRSIDPSLDSGKVERGCTSVRCAVLAVEVAGVEEED